MVGGEPLRGIVVRLPVGHDVVAAATAGLDFVAVDLVAGPSDETSRSADWRPWREAAALGVVAIVVRGGRNVSVLGADVVIDS